MHVKNGKINLIFHFYRPNIAAESRMGPSPMEVMLYCCMGCLVTLMIGIAIWVFHRRWSKQSQMRLTTESQDKTTDAGTTATTHDQVKREVQKMENLEKQKVYAKKGMTPEQIIKQQVFIMI